MKPMELTRQERVIDEALEYGKTLADGLPERAMIARYVCVLASGYLENVIRVYLCQFTRQSRPRREVERYVEAAIDQFRNPSFPRIMEITAHFDDSWSKHLDVIDESIKDAITSIVANRHLIAHGRHSGISLAQVADYVKRAKEFAKEFEKICR